MFGLAQNIMTMSARHQFPGMFHAMKTDDQCRPLNFYFGFLKTIHDFLHR